MLNKPPVMIDASRLRHRIQLVSMTAGAQDVYGDESTPTGTPYSTVWASVDVASAKDIYQSQQEVSQVSHNITIRYMGGVSPGDGVVFDGRFFRIQAVMNPEERDIMLNLMCLEINGGTPNIALTAPPI